MAENHRKQNDRMDNHWVNFQMEKLFVSPNQDEGSDQLCLTVGIYMRWPNLQPIILWLS